MGHCADLNGKWIDEPEWYTPKDFVQDGCYGTFEAFDYEVQGKRIIVNMGRDTLEGTFVVGDRKDTIAWDNGLTWEKYKDGFRPEDAAEDSSTHQLRFAIPCILLGTTRLL